MSFTRNATSSESLQTLRLALRGFAILVATTGWARAETASTAMESVRQALEAQYATITQAYFDRNPEPVFALRTPDYSTHMPSGERWTRERTDAYTHAAFAQVEKTLELTFHIDSLTVRADTAVAAIHQHWVREQQKAGRLRHVDTEARQRETWIKTPDGWRLWLVDDIHPGNWWIDGKRVDPHKPYDPEAPPFAPDSLPRR